MHVCCTPWWGAHFLSSLGRTLSEGVPAGSRASEHRLMCSRCSERPKDGPHSCFSAHRIKIESKQRVGIFSQLLTFKAQFKAAVTFTDHTALNTGRATLGSEGGGSNPVQSETLSQWTSSGLLPSSVAPGFFLNMATDSNSKYKTVWLGLTFDLSDARH